MAMPYYVEQRLSPDGSVCQLTSMRHCALLLEIGKTAVSLKVSPHETVLISEYDPSARERVFVTFRPTSADGTPSPRGYSSREKVFALSKRLVAGRAFVWLAKCMVT